MLRAARSACSVTSTDARVAPVTSQLVDLLLEAGHPVVPVKSNALKAWRDAEVLSGAKSDPGDAMVVAEYLRLRHHKLSAARPFSPQTKALRTVVRTRDDVVRVRAMAEPQFQSYSAARARSKHSTARVSRNAVSYRVVGVAAGEGPRDPSAYRFPIK
ncbi:transposase [Streptomyces sp. NPDC019645]|uniref:IS110 family transposase n=1 Tax=Streptomyces sp. NPDC019645 TaxID=3154786 RepID=UPI0033D3D1CA